MGLFYLLLIAGVAYFAKLRGRSPLAWAVIALLISPLISGILLLFLKNLSFDGYKGDTIDTTAKPVPDHDTTAPKRTDQGVEAKRHEDVDAAISRMEEKLSKDKVNENITTARANATLGVASVLTSSGKPTKEIAEPIICEAEANEFNPSSQEVSSIATATTQEIYNPEVTSESETEVASSGLIEAGNEVESSDLRQFSSQSTAEDENFVQLVMAQAAGGAVVLEDNEAPKAVQFCECCGESIKEGANFCTNCGAPIAK